MPPQRTSSLISHFTEEETEDSWSPVSSYTGSCQCWAPRPLDHNTLHSEGEAKETFRSPRPFCCQRLPIRPLSLASGPRHSEILTQVLFLTHPRTEDEKPGGCWLTETGSPPWQWSNHITVAPRGCPSRRQVSSPSCTGLHHRRPERLCHGQNTPVDSSNSPEWVASARTLFWKHSGHQIGNFVVKKISTLFTSCTSDHFPFPTLRFHY